MLRPSKSRACFNWELALCVFVITIREIAMKSLACSKLFQECLDMKRHRFTHSVQKRCIIIPPSTGHFTIECFDRWETTRLWHLWQAVPSALRHEATSLYTFWREAAQHHSSSTGHFTLFSLYVIEPLPQDFKVALFMSGLIHEIIIH